MSTFDGAVAVVTGSGRGIGESIARTLADRGARLAVADLDGEAAERIARSIDPSGSRVLAFAGDVTDASFAPKLIAELERRLGPVEILVNNAGIIRDALVENISETDWDAVIDVNLKGAFLCARSMVPGMKARGHGKIVNIVSRAWLGNVGQSNYSASKGGLVSLTRTLALELARHHINVNAVAPGLIDTPLTRALPEKVRDKLLRAQPTREMGTAADIANAVCFLASDEATFITGQVLHVDGGKSAGLLSL